MCILHQHLNVIADPSTPIYSNNVALTAVAFFPQQDNAPRHAAAKCSEMVRETRFITVIRHV